MKIILNKALFFIKPEILEKLYLIMDYNGKGAINEKEFMVIMRPWASFSATDINNDNELDNKKSQGRRKAACSDVGGWGLLLGSDVGCAM